MERGSMQLLWAATQLIYCGLIYFCCIHLPVWAPLSISGLIFMLSYRFVLQPLRYEMQPVSDARRRRAYRLFAFCLLALAGVSGLLARPYGDWDAWNIWNFHARYLAHPELWQSLFGNDSAWGGNTNYPYGISAPIALGWRLTGSYTPVIPFIMSLLPTMLIPLILFLEHYRRNLWLAAALLLLLATDRYFMNQGLNQYADTWMGLLLMGALLCGRHYKKLQDPRALWMAGALLGAALWTKNEGLLLACFFILFQLRILAGRSQMMHFVLGIAPFLCVLAWFKTSFAPAHPLLQSLDADWLSRLRDTARFTLILKHFFWNLGGRFYLLSAGLLIYVYWLLRYRQRPSRQFYMLLCCLLAYLGIYLFVQTDPEWNLNTSLSRLLHQLMPAFLLVISLDVSARPMPDIKQGRA